jgi:hypothetical protein
MEKEIKDSLNWVYNHKPRHIAQQASKRHGRKLKGCIELLIVYMKVDHVNQIQDVGVRCQGMKLTKSCPNEDCYKDGKYVPNWPREYCVVEVKEVPIVSKPKKNIVSNSGEQPRLQKLTYKHTRNESIDDDEKSYEEPAPTQYDLDRLAKIVRNEKYLKEQGFGPKSSVQKN